MTVNDLLDYLSEVPIAERDHRYVRVVYHGWEKPSFNLPATQARTGANCDDYLLITEEPRS